MSSDLVRVDLKKPRYDQSTFYGRLRHFLQITDVRLVFTTETQLQNALKRIKDYSDKGCPPVPKDEAEKIWEAKKIKDGIIHWQTGEKIPLPFRLSAFVPMNVGIVAGMLGAAPTIPQTIFWQWINQSYNLLLNHSNRNASNPLEYSTIFKTYGGAVVISAGVAVGLGQFVSRAKGLSPTLRSTIQKFVPFTAVATAGVANVFLMRWNEARDGINVTDEEGKVLGKSPKAGFNALTQVSISRVMTSLPVLTFPPIIMGVLGRTALLKNNPKLKTFTDLVVIAAMLWTGLPAAIAIFPQVVEISPLKLEPQFHNLKDSQGKPITKVYYDKGL